MACFIIPAVEAVAATVAVKIMDAKEKKNSLSIESQKEDSLGNETKIPFSKKLKWLSNLLWGGSALLAFEHIWHGELTLWFPFLTAAAQPSSTKQMLHEMATSGIAMAAVVTIFWGIMVLATSALEKKEPQLKTEEN